MAATPAIPPMPEFMAEIMAENRRRLDGQLEIMAIVAEFERQAASHADMDDALADGWPSAAMH